MFRISGYFFTQFNEPAAAEAISLDKDPKDSDQPESSSGSETDASDSSGSSKEATSRHPIDANFTDQVEEAITACCTRVQHALIPGKGPACVSYRGRSLLAACGVHLNPQTVSFSDHPDSHMRMCQRKACLKAWNALLL